VPDGRLSRGAADPAARALLLLIGALKGLRNELLKRSIMKFGKELDKMLERRSYIEWTTL
jgi:hypothetical protein